jgi:hypothetical protein
VAVQVTMPAWIFVGNDRAAPPLDPLYPLRTGPLVSSIPSSLHFLCSPSSRGMAVGFSGESRLCCPCSKPAPPRHDLASASAQSCCCRHVPLPRSAAATGAAATSSCCYSDRRCRRPELLPHAPPPGAAVRPRRKEGRRPRRDARAH